MSTLERMKPHFEPALEATAGAAEVGIARRRHEMYTRGEASDQGGDLKLEAPFLGAFRNADAVDQSGVWGE